MKGGTGAPLEPDELEEIEKAFPLIRRYLPEEHLQVIDEEGLWKYYMGGPVTPCIEDRACVFVMYEDGIAKCAFEKAFLERKTNWRKPLSCHLFPIRVDRGETVRLRFEFIEECRPALDHGDATSTKAIDFVQAALLRLLGKTWSNRLQKARQAAENEHAESLRVEVE